MKLFDEYFPYKTPDRLLLNFHGLERAVNNKNTEEMIESLFECFGNNRKGMPEDVKKNEGKKSLMIIIKILDFNLNEQIPKEQGLKILTLSQMLNRLPISLAQLKAGNN